MFGRFDRLVDGVGTGVFVFLLALVSFSVDKKFHQWFSGLNGNSQQNSTMLVLSVNHSYYKQQIPVKLFLALLEGSYLNCLLKSLLLAAAMVSLSE